VVFSREDVLAAQDRIRGFVRRTPTLVASGPEEVWLKCEFLQHCGVFKTRGAFNRQLAARERGELDPSIGIVVASGGNAGLAHAYAARQLGVPATVFVPAAAPAVKVQRIAEYGARVHRVGAEYAEAYQAATRFARDHGALFCHAYDQPEIAAGAGTIAEELLDDNPDIEVIVVAVGGGGLFAGVAAAAAGRAEVVAVEPATIPTLHADFAQGAPVDVSVSGVAADALGARRIGEIAFDVAQRVPPHSVLVSDAEIVAARAELWQRYRIAAEHGAATAYAAVHTEQITDLSGMKTAVIVCGANTDPRTLEIE
jgi:threonine dehydratase